MPGQGTETRAEKPQTPGYHPKSDHTPIFTEGDLVARARVYVTELSEQLTHGKSEHLLTYLGFLSKCPKYSRRNRMLIASQMPDATHVRSFNDWKKDGFQVRHLNKDPKRGKVEHGIGILAPKFLKVKDLEAAERGEEKEKLIIDHFIPVFVFDVSHLIPADQARVPEFFTTVAGDYEGLYRRVVQAATLEGYNVAEMAFPGSEGQGFSFQKEITIRRSIAIGNKVLTAIHEWTHAKLHWTPEGQKLDTETQECHAAAVEYAVALHFGIKADYSADYLLHWGTDEKRLKAELDIVSNTAVHMMKAIHALEPGEEATHDLAEPEPQEAE